MLRWLVLGVLCRIAVLAVLIAVLPVVGCTNLLFTVAYMIKGTAVDSRFRGIEGQEGGGRLPAADVAPVRQPERRPRPGRADYAAARRSNVPKIKIDRPAEDRQVDRRAHLGGVSRGRQGDEGRHGRRASIWRVSSLYQGQTLYQGKANATIHVYDCTKSSGKQVFHKSIPAGQIPARTPPWPCRTGRGRAGLHRTSFELVLSNNIARYFFAHDPDADLRARFRRPEIAAQRPARLV